MIPPGRSGRQSDPASRVRPSRPIPARPLNLLGSIAGALSRLTPGRGLGGRSAGAPGLYAADAGPFAARIGGAGNPYTLTEVYGTPGGGWATLAGGRVVDAYEINGQTGLAGNVALDVRQNDEGVYVFTFHRFPSSCSGALKVRVVEYCGPTIPDYTPVPGAAVTLTDGVSTWADTTDADGYVTFTGLPDHTTYSYTAAKAGFTTEAVTGLNLACSAFSMVGLYTPRLCLAVVGCVGGVPVVGAGVTITDPASGTTGSGTTGSDGRVCIDMPGVVIPAANASVPVGVAVSSPYAGLADASVTRVLRSAARCGDYEMVSVALGPAPGYTCCCPFGTPTPLHYSDDFGSCEIADGFGEYTFTCPCGADSVLCDAYGTRRTSDTYAKSIRVRIAVACAWHIHDAGTPGKIRFLVTRSWGALGFLKCDGTATHCNGWPSTDWDDPYGINYPNPGLSESADTDYVVDCDPGYAFSVSGSYGVVTTPSNPLPVASQDCAAAGFTLSS